MSNITDYNSLSAAIRNWVARSDTKFTAAIPVFVASAEERIYNGAGDYATDAIYSPALRNKTLEELATVTVTDGVGALPADALGVRKIVRVGDTFGQHYITPERLAVNTTAVPNDPNPIHYTVEDDQLRLASAISTTIDILYFKRFPAVSQDQQTSPVLTAHPLLYLEACLYEAYSWEREAELALAHLTKYRGIVQGLNKTAMALRFPGPLRVQVRAHIP